ncbi:hypothetical protein CDL15_Pgr000014 [Punica granatum]|uniref:Uncharacterized protein n=1 Tax=Punica granatum TaxID=22663 RepID=A0A218VRF8_PUNGR|nr:hypothetical protein CDL15_Pgr000014 [Punica granatum]
MLPRLTLPLLPRRINLPRWTFQKNFNQASQLPQLQLKNLVHPLNKQTNPLSQNQNN